jgi:hypothetical protein
MMARLRLWLRVAGYATYQPPPARSQPGLRPSLFPGCFRIVHDAVDLLDVTAGW